MYKFNKKLIYNKIILDSFKYFLSMIFSFGLIVWVIQAVNYLEFVTEDGHSFLVYIQYSLLNLPKIISRLLPFAFFTTLFLTISKIDLAWPPAPKIANVISNLIFFLL